MTEKSQIQKKKMIETLFFASPQYAQKKDVHLKFFKSFETIKKEKKKNFTTIIKTDVKIRYSFSFVSLSSYAHTHTTHLNIA